MVCAAKALSPKLLIGLDLRQNRLNKAKKFGADIVLNLSASDDITGKYDYLLDLVRQQSARCVCGYVYSSAGFGESSTDLVFDGKCIIAENGTMLSVSGRWQK